MNNTVKLGLILTAIGVLTNAIMFFTGNTAIMFSLKNGLIVLALICVITVILGRKMLRDPEEDRLGYGQAVKKLFIALFISILISSIINVFMYGNNEDLKEQYEVSQIEAQEAAFNWTADMTGMDAAQKEEALEDMRRQREDGELASASYPFSWSALPVQIGVSTIMYLLLALLLALFVREKETQHA